VRAPFLLRLFIFGFTFLLSARAQTSGPHELASPNGELVFTFALTPNGVPTYEVRQRNDTIIAPSKLGLTRNPNSTLGNDWKERLKVAATDHRSVDTTWKQVWGERAEVRDHYNAIDIDLRTVSGDHGTLRLEIRAYDEGLAFRYFFPESLQNQVIEIGGELTEFNLPTDTLAYWTPSAQKPYEKLPLKNWRSDAEVPLTLALPNGHWLCITEAEQTGYTRMRLKLSGATRLTTQLFAPVTEASPYATAWRVILVAEKPGQLLENNFLLLNLNPPNALADTSWIHPGKAMRETTLSTAGAKRLVDFAVEQNIDYLHFDAGWYGHEYEIASDATEAKVDPRRNPKGDLDLPAAIRYAKSKGKRVILYVNHRALERQLDVLFPLYEKWGVSGVKFGFVQTGSQHWTLWLHDAVKLAAKHHLVVDIHDDFRPTGFSRTYPNLLTQEGIYGNEEFPDATQSTIFPFTRFIAGAADHTFCFNDRRLKNTKAHQLALPAIHFSPLQYLFWYGRPGDYPDRAEIEFWKELPTTWEETRVVNGMPGEFVTVARRHGDDWWLGGVTNTGGRSLEIAFDFLPSDQKFLADIYEDADRKIVVKRTVEVTAVATLTFDLKPSGGVAIRLRRQGRPAETTPPPATP
jgi:alpha-glucosidase